MPHLQWQQDQPPRATVRGVRSGSESGEWLHPAGRCVERSPQSPRARARRRQRRIQLTRARGSNHAQAASVATFTSTTPAEIRMKAPVTSG